MYSGFVLISSGKTHRHGNDCHEERKKFLYRFSQIPRNRRHDLPCRRATQGSIRIGQEAEGVGRKMGARGFIMDFIGKNSSGRLCRFKIGYYEQSQWSGVYIKPELSGTPVLE